ncbi:MAG: DUF1254 domain-containing protein [Hyphomicrobiales bacterium]|nr:DUF1254 domain-containing protein [Hyphomicrobiales bacterium]
MVIDVPPAGEKAEYFGTIVNAWQTPIADVGPSGDDKGEGGEYLVPPPAARQTSNAPEYCHRPNRATRVRTSLCASLGGLHAGP